MKILLYGLNYSPELTGSGKYTGELADWLSDQGHSVRAIVAPPYYPDWKVAPRFHSWRYSVSHERRVRVIRCPLYVPRTPKLMSRMLHLASFALSSSLPLLLQLRWKPDVLITIAPTLCCAPGALFFSKATNARSVLHIQDFEIDAMFGLGLAKPGQINRWALKFEQWMLKGFNRISTISPAMLARAESKGVSRNKLILFPNWSDTEKFQHARSNPDLLHKLGVNPNKKTILYAGNLGEKQGLEYVIAVAAKCVSQPHLQFLIVGDGVAKHRLMQMAQDQRLENIRFAHLQPVETLPSLLASADCHLVIQKRGAADMVLPSKLTNILAVGGNAVITADKDTSLGALCDHNPGIAIRVEPESIDELYRGILQALELPRPNPIAVSYAREHLQKEEILQKFLNAVKAIS